MATKLSTFQGVTMYRAKQNDINGNPRIFVHFLAFLRENETPGDFGGVLECYEAMKPRARRAGFRPFHGREFGGGFVCQYDYCNGREIAARVVEARNA